MAEMDRQSAPLRVRVAVGLLVAALLVNIFSWLVIVSNLSPSGQEDGLMVMASVVVVAGTLISLVGIGNRWALLALTAFLGFAEGPNVLDVLSGGVDRPLWREDLIVEAIEAALAGVALSLLWTKQSRDWFFRRSGRKTHHAAQ